ncbi:MAG: nucleotidyltransferase domain-containing protein [bacterium]
MVRKHVVAEHIVEIIKRYIEELKNNNIPVDQVIIFGSYAKGQPKEESDIDIALISPVFTGDRYEDRRRIVPLRRKIDNRIEPIPFRPEDFCEDGNLIDEIKKTGKVLKF